MINEFDNHHILALAAEISDGATISSDRAMETLELLDLWPLLESIRAARRVMSQSAYLLALGFPPKAVSQAVGDSEGFELRLANLRLSTRVAPRLEAAPEDQTGIDVCKVSLLVGNITAPGTWAFGHDPARVRREISRPTLADSLPQSRPPDLTDDDVDRLCEELAARIGISCDQSFRVLKLFNVDLLIEHINTARRIISDRFSLCALGLSADAIARAAKDSASFTFELDALRLATRKGALVGSPVFLREMMASSRDEMLATAKNFLASASG